MIVLQSTPGADFWDRLLGRTLSLSSNVLLCSLPLSPQRAARETGRAHPPTDRAQQGWVDVVNLTGHGVPLQSCPSRFAYMDELSRTRSGLNRNPWIVESAPWDHVSVILRRPISRQRLPLHLELTQSCGGHYRHVDAASDAAFRWRNSPSAGGDAEHREPGEHAADGLDRGQRHLPRDSQSAASVAPVLEGLPYASMGSLRLWVSDPPIRRRSRLIQ